MALRYVRAQARPHCKAAAIVRIATSDMLGRVGAKGYTKLST